MSNFNDLLAETAQEERKAREAAEARHRREAVKLAELDSVSNGAALQGESHSSSSGGKGVQELHPTPALPRSNSSQTPLDDAMLEETGVALKMCGYGGKATGKEGVTQQLCAMAGLHPPSQQSFEEFYLGWFEHEHFPIFCEELKRELVRRAKTKGFFSGLSSQVKKWALANTDERLQMEAWRTYFIEHAPPKYKVFGCLRIANVNLGSQATPCWVRFYGLPASEEKKECADQWVLMPWTSHFPDLSSVLDELDGRGGMAALVAAST
mmetsp:Transcript_31994/g.74981  ORF Transcript_31994/g.74981 Transcript_31994/m.74981 type:complete len:267 (-) Transcript_31994:77-877(-)